MYISCRKYLRPFSRPCYGVLHLGWVNCSGDPVVEQSLHPHIPTAKSTGKALEGKEEQKGFAYSVVCILVWVILSLEQRKRALWAACKRTNMRCGSPLH